MRIVAGLMVSLALGASAGAQSMSEEDAFALYQSKEGNKAFASNGSGAWGVTFGAHFLSDALNKALGACEKNRTKGSRACVIIAEDAIAVRMGRAGLSMSPSAQADYDHYLAQTVSHHKAFAVSPDGPWGSASAASLSGARSAALAQCNAMGDGLAPCIVVDVDGYKQRY